MRIVLIRKASRRHVRHFSAVHGRRLRRELRMRPVFVRLHRWFGIGIALFLFVAGLTGALIAWDHELDAMLNPTFFYARAATRSRCRRWNSRAASKRVIRAFR
jgi:uncharacterized iron-regulated membrane protein